MIINRCFAHITKRRYSILLHKMEKSGIVPDVLDELPQELAEVTFSRGVKVEIGRQLKPVQVKAPPVIKWTAEPTQLYTVLFTDPDAPARVKPVFREWQHWLVGNVPGMSIAKGDVLSAYIGAGPPKGSGLHRYVFLVFKQKGGIKFTERRLFNNSVINRGNFSTRNFAEKYHLGMPVAGNFFESQWDNYVPELYRQIGIQFD